MNAKGPVSALAFQNAAQSSIATAVGEAFAAATASFCGSKRMTQNSILDENYTPGQ